MNYSTHYGMNKPEPAEQYNLSDWNENTDSIDTNLHDLQTKITAEVERATAQEETNRSVNRLLGTLPISQGGTGKTTNQDALNELHKNVTTQTSIDANDEITFIKRTSENVSQGIPETIDIKDVTLTTLAEKVFEILKTDNSKVFNGSNNGFTPKTNSLNSLNFLRSDGQWEVPQLKEDLYQIQSSNSYSLNSNSILKITATSAVTIVLTDANIVGLTVTIINDSDTLTHSLSCTNVEGNTVDSILPNAYFKIAWNGSAWVNITAPSAGASFTQYPQQESPDKVYPCTTWEVVDYGGAFFRASGGNAAAFNGGKQGQNIQSHKHSFSWSGSHSHGVTDPGHRHGYELGVNDSDRGCGGERTKYHFGDASTYGATTGISVNSATVSISGTTGAAGGNETRPENYTYRIWKRIS